MSETIVFIVDLLIGVCIGSFVTWISMRKSNETQDEER